MWEKLKGLSSEKKAFLLMITLMGSSMLYGWFHEEPKLPTRQPIALAPAPAVKNIPKDEVSVPKLKVYRKSDLAKKAVLSEEVKQDENKKVTAVSEVPPTKGGAEITSVTDINTGETVLYAREKPLSLFGFENEKAIGIGYGISTRGEQQVKLYGRYTFIRVGNVYGSAYGEVNTGGLNGPEAKAFAEAEYRFPK